VVPVNDRGEVLLLHGRDPARHHAFTYDGVDDEGDATLYALPLSNLDLPRLMAPAVEAVR
jgi:hypothetical protein